MSQRVFTANRAVRRPRAVAVAAVAVSLAVAAAVPAAASGTDARRVQLLELTRKLVDAGAPGVVVRVDDGRGRPIEIAEQAPWTRPDHVLQPGDEYRVASSTKTVMATLVLQLVAERRIALTDSVEKWLPGKVAGGNAITVRMLLNHTSGLFDYLLDPAMVPAILGKDRHQWTLAELLAVGVRNDPRFPPGTRSEYSNTNYIAVGAILERVTGKSVADLVRDRIARPLNLKHTYYAADSSWRGSHAHGYEPDAAHMPPAVPAEFRDFAGAHRDGHVDVSDNTMSAAGSAGAMVSTPQDWSRFLTALMSGRLLPAAQLAQLRTTVPMFPDQPDGPGQGLGIQTAVTPCGRIWMHEGGIPGYLSVNMTDSVGGRSAMFLVTTEIWSEFAADQKLAEANKALSTAVICSMFGKPVPAQAG